MLATVCQPRDTSSRVEKRDSGMHTEIAANSNIGFHANSLDREKPDKLLPAIVQGDKTV